MQAVYTDRIDNNRIKTLNYLNFQLIYFKKVQLFKGAILMIVLTTPTIEGKKIVKYIGLVSGEAIMGANIFKDIFAGIRDIVGGRSAAYEGELREAKEIAIAEMKQQAKDLGGNAVIAVDLDYETIGSGGTNMLMVCASGTAIVYKDKPMRRNVT